MCGITGICYYGGSRGTVNNTVLDRMCSTLAHRGPDGAGRWISHDRRIGLAMQRLAIRDVARGNQPMIGKHGEVLVFNGEIYNYPALRRGLEREGVSFFTSCDTEVVLRLYEQRGIACLNALNGMFALAIWDPWEEALLMARDGLGEKPLYWADTAGVLLFGSEIKALLEHPLVTPAVNERAISPYLTNLVTSPPDTLYRGVHKLAAGTAVRCDASGVRTWRWCDLLSPEEPQAVAGRDAARTVRLMLERSVDQRLAADVPVGVLLSGGLDSTTLLALLRERTAGLATFSVGFSDHPDLDERAHARRVAAAFGTDHHEVAITQRDAITFLPRLVYHQDEPLADPVCVPLDFVCGLARTHGVPVVLAGEGADELFWGYPRYRRAMARERWMWAVMQLPPEVRRVLAALTPARRLPDLRQWLEGLAAGRPLPIHLPLGLTRYHRARVLADPTYATRIGWAPSDTTLPRGRRGLRTQLMLDTQDYEFRLRLPELLLMRIDRFSMANGVEARVPFLDPELVQYVYHLPLEYKLRDGIGKVLLRDAVRDIVPGWVLARRKQGFGAPVITWLGSHMGVLFDSLATSEPIRRYFNVEILRRAMTTFGGRSTHGLWPILNFALWHRRWIEGEPLEPLLEPLLKAVEDRSPVHR